MAQKILASRSDESTPPHDDLVKVRVDQLVLTRGPSRVLAESFAMGLKKSPVESVVIYDGRCITSSFARPEESEPVLDDLSFDPTAYSLTLARPGIGFPPAVHLERFAAPGRLLLTDDPRMSTVGGIGTLSFVGSSSQLARAIVDGTATVRVPRTIQILLSGKNRPFVCARDVLHELIRRGLEDLVRTVEQRTGQPVVLEFAGQSAKLLSVGERAVLSTIAPLVGATGALFISDEKTETYLRDQRRSKAHRALAPDSGAPCEEVVQLDLSTVDPLVMDPAGVIRTARDVAGKPVSQVVLGGDASATARDFLAAAILLKSKKIGPHMDFLVIPPSRQILEILAKTGALSDILATGGRIIEPDRLTVSGELYPSPPPDNGIAVRTSDMDPFSPRAGAYVASAESVAFAVAHGVLGDPRAFKRPVRVPSLRELPTDDQLVVRERRDAPGALKKPPTIAPMPATAAFKTPENVLVYHPHKRANPKAVGPDNALGEIIPGPWAAVCESIIEIRYVALHSARLAPAAKLRALIARHIPGGLIAQLTGHGILCLQVDPHGFDHLKGAKEVTIPVPSSFNPSAQLVAGKFKVMATWVALPEERASIGTTGTKKKKDSASQ